MAYDGSRAQYYRDKARQVRELARGVWNAVLKDEYEQIAKEYERLARQAEAGLISL